MAEPWLRGPGPADWDGNTLGHRSRMSTRSGLCCLSPSSAPQHTETEGMQAVRSCPPALFAWHWCICAAQVVVPGGQGTGTLCFFPTLLIKPTRNRSVCFHLQALVSAQQIEDFLCIVWRFPFPLSTLNSTCISSTEHFSFKCCSHKLLYISQEKKKPSSLNRRNLSSTTHWPPAYHCGFFHFLPTSAFPIASLFHFKFYLYHDVIHNELGSRKSWCNQQPLEQEPLQKRM